MSKHNLQFSPLILLMICLTPVLGLISCDEGTGEETPRTCTFDNVLVNGEPYTGQVIMIKWDGFMTIEFDFEGVSWEAWSTGAAGIFQPTHGEGSQHYLISLADPNEDGTVHIEGSGEGGPCTQLVHYQIY